ncbi:ABC transporter substrate-binding protein [uncultured Thiodictyon sp.]|nr:ABC transporter substrate-binding protein [uncultured Thiodictyon sp.]
MAGRTVAVPDPVARPFGAAPPLTALLLALAPDLVHALNMPLAPGALDYLPPPAAPLPVLGSAMGHGRQINPEALLAVRPDLALAWLNAASDLDQAGIEAPFRKIGVPVFFLKLDTLEDWPAAFETAGRLLGREARAQALADYIRAAQARVTAAVSGIASAQQVRVYYAEGPDGLATDCNTSFHTEAIALAGAYNVYRCTAKTMVGQERVSLEQVLLWQPQVLLVQDPVFARTVRHDPRWAQVPAVAAGRVIAIPRLPLNWIDRPPSFMRALGIQWLANALYPERLPLDLEAETRRFYTLFFGVEPTQAQVAALLHVDSAGTAP